MRRVINIKTGAHTVAGDVDASAEAMPEPAPTAGEIFTALKAKGALSDKDIETAKAAMNGEPE